MDIIQKKISKEFGFLHKSYATAVAMATMTATNFILKTDFLLV
jgi:hypothetical protein